MYHVCRIGTMSKSLLRCRRLGDIRLGVLDVYSGETDKPSMLTLHLRGKLIEQGLLFDAAGTTIPRYRGDIDNTKARHHPLHLSLNGGSSIQRGEIHIADEAGKLRYLSHMLQYTFTSSINSSLPKGRAWLIVAGTAYLSPASGPCDPSSASSSSSS